MYFWLNSSPIRQKLRKYLDPADFGELTASVTQHGIMDPILFRQDGNTMLLYVVAGERRCAAVRKADMLKVVEKYLTR